MSDIDYATFKGKMVELTRTVDGETEVLTGRIIEGNTLGVVFKRKSQRVQDLYDANEITNVTEVASARLHLVSQKRLRLPGEANIRRHLADNHGWSRSDLNEMADVEAMRRHAEIDHSDLGHYHSNEAPKERPSSARESREDVLARIAAVRAISA